MPPKSSSTSSSSSSKRTTPSSFRKPTKVKSLGHQRKETLVEQIHELCNTYTTVYTFDVLNSRSTLIKDARVASKEFGRFVFGKLKVMRIALGTSEDEAYKPGLHILGDKIEGGTGGLFFTNLPHKKVLKMFHEFSNVDFSRTGSIATRKVEMKAGPLVGFPSSMLEQFRSMGLPVALDRGTIMLEQDFIICNEGDTLTSQQARALKAFGVKLSEFKMRVLWRWEAGKIQDVSL
jgi:mRNA turnover protein 4